MNLEGSLLTPLISSPPQHASSISRKDYDYNSTTSVCSSIQRDSITSVFKRVSRTPTMISSSKNNGSSYHDSIDTTPRVELNSENESPISCGITKEALRFLYQHIRSHRYKLTISELSGSLGDLGTFIPLTVALARGRKIALAPALFWAGICNVITGCLWDVPMCVQPMKSIAAVALTENGSGFDAGSVTAAGILSGASVLLLGVTNLMEVVNWLVPLTVVCGLQVGVGLRLASSGIQDVQKLTWWGGYDCIMLSIGCALLSVFWLRDIENGAKKKTTRIPQDTLGEVVRQRSLAVTDEVLANTYATLSSEMNSSRSEHSNLEQDSVNRVEMGTMTTFGSEQRIEEVLTSGQVSADRMLSHSRHHVSDSALICFRVMLKRACCCLNPFPNTPHPVGIYLFLIGCLFAAITLATATADSGFDLPLHFFGAPIFINAVKNVTPFNWRQGFFQGTLPQLPLTTLNSVISVCCLAHALYPEKRNPSLVAKHRTDAVVTRREVCISVGLMNLILCPLGSMPNCHGAGGLAGQHRFGARHGTSVIVLGSFKIFIAVFFGGSALTLLDALPVAVLGIMLVIAGLELVGTGVSMLFEHVKKEEDETSARIEASGRSDSMAVNSNEIMRKNCLVVMVTAGVIIALQKTHYGALSGLVVHTILGRGKEDFSKLHRKLGTITTRT